VRRLILLAFILVLIFSAVSHAERLHVEDFCYHLNSTWVCLLPRSYSASLSIPVNTGFRLVCQTYSIVYNSSTRMLTVVSGGQHTMNTTVPSSVAELQVDVNNLGVYVYAGNTTFSMEREVCILYSRVKPSGYATLPPAAPQLPPPYKLRFIGSIVSGSGAYIIYANATHVVIAPVGSPSPTVLYAVDVYGKLVSVYWLKPSVLVYPVTPDAFTLVYTAGGETVALPLKTEHAVTVTKPVTLTTTTTITRTVSKTVTVPVTVTRTTTTTVTRTVTRRVPYTLTATMTKISPMPVTKTIIRTVTATRIMVRRIVRAPTWLTYAGVALIVLGACVAYGVWRGYIVVKTPGKRGGEAELEAS